jgi:hypothetical protein
VYSLKKSHSFPFAWCVFLSSLIRFIWTAPRIEEYLWNQDLAFPLAAGKQILLGKIPCFDYIIQWGPLHAYLSAALLYFHDSPISETIFASLIFSCAMALLFKGLSCHIGVKLSIVSVALCLLFPTNFYRWFFWLSEAYLLFLSMKYLEGRRWSLYAISLLSGLAFWYRVDLGLIGYIYGVSIIFIRLLNQRKRLLLELSKHTCFFILVISSLFTFLYLTSGNIGAYQYISKTFLSSTNIPSYYQRSLSQFDMMAILSLRTGEWLAYGMTISTIFFGFIYSVRQWLTDKDDLVIQKNLAVIILAIGYSPYLFYRMGAQYFFEVFPLIASANFVIYTMVANKKKRTHIFCYFSAAVWTIGLIGCSKTDILEYEKFHLNPMYKYRKLLLGLENDVTYPQLPIMQKIIELTPSDRTVLSLSYFHQLYYFSNRKMSGMLECYNLRILDNNYWRTKNLQMIKQDPPSCVLVDQGFMDRSDKMLEMAQPELCDFVRSQYPIVSYSKAGFHILTPRPTL